MHVRVLIVVSLVCLASARADERVQFNRDIRPILSQHCFACHGLDASQRKADLRLDQAASAYADRNGSRAVRPRDLAGSELWARVQSTDPDTVMPPPAKKRLTPEQRDLLRRWIEQGAEYQNHWAFEPVAAAAPPGVAQNAIDQFLRARLERERLVPQPEADRETLIRRVAFTLTGLPPTIAEVDSFLADRADGAYERMVDRYLASKHFGEEQARHWLDLARYADTHGLHLDNERQMWAYRDWVVDAFNANLPFDQFTTWQLAGDLLPNATLAQQVATGFNRCNVSTAEGGSIEPEWVFRNAVDRTSTMIQTWLGLTGGCAVCHDHKYDPLSSKEFYSLYAFFYSAADPGLDGNIRNTTPFLKVPTPAQATALAEASARESAARTRLADAVAKGDYRDPADDSPAADSPARSRRPVVDVILDDDFPFGSKATNTSRNAAEWPLDPEFGTHTGRRVLELASSGDYDVTVQLATLPVLVPHAGRLELWLHVDPHYPPDAFAVQLDDGKPRRAVWGAAAELPNAGSQHVVVGTVPESGKWHKLSVGLEALGLAVESRVKTLVLLVKGGRVWVDAVQVAGELAPAVDPGASFQAWWKASAGGTPGGVPGDLVATLTAGPKPDAAARERLLRFYLQDVQRPGDSPVRAERLAAEEARLARVCLDDAVPGTFVFRDLDTPRTAHVMLRGQYDKPGEKVEPDVPAAFPPLAKKPGTRPTRLDLAQWLLRPDHPLTARVQVNRVWQQVFGVGLVKTSFDFGSQGEPPSHPELLDWLAAHYRESGWNTKGLLKLLLCSATFRQSSALPRDAELRARLPRDPENRLLARGPRFRLDAEQIRDNALFVSGLMSLEMGGRGVRSYQPPNIWEPVGYQNSNTRFYLQDHGPALYRRSLYCFLKRTAPPPFMSNFDGPNREQFCSRRERSNTPLQALQLLNDVQHFEAARALAERTIAAVASPDERIDYLYRTVLSRRPDAAERALVRGLYESQREHFAAQPAAADRAVKVGESPARKLAPSADVAAWSIVANLVLNLDETLTRN